jgi:translation initiation factor 4A
MRQPVTKVLVVYDVQVKTPEVSHTPLIINYGA